MKKICAFLIACLICALLPGSPSFAHEGNESVCASIPYFPVTVNGVQYNNRYSKYPFLVYNDITYLPLTYDMAAFTGLMITFDKGGIWSWWYRQTTYHFGEMILYVGYNEITSENLEQHIQEIANPDTREAVIPDYYTYISHDYLSYEEASLLHPEWRATDYIREYDNESPYPILNVEGVTYIPLTWDVAHRLLDWEYSFSEESGLVIDTTRAVRPIHKCTRLFGGSQDADFILGEHYYLSYDHELYTSAGTFRLVTEDGVFEYVAGKDLRGKMDYFNAMYENDVRKTAKIPPTINDDGILTMMCAVNMTPRHNVMITVDVKNGAVLQVEQIE